MQSHEHGGDAPCWAHLIEDPDVPAIRARRMQEPADPHDGQRVLVDSEWPHDLNRDDAGVDLWLRDIGPSAALAAWFGGDVARWPEFQFRYRQELETRPGWSDDLLAASRLGAVTLVFAAADHWHNHAVVLKALLEQRLREESKASRTP